jgi:pimeloyl-ACP methyl ester carboxylesterase
MDVEEDRILHREDTGQDTFSILDGSIIADLFPMIDITYNLQWKVRATNGKVAISSEKWELCVLSSIGKEYTLPSSFPGDFSPPEDQLTGTVLGGWGGSEGCIIHTPIVFLHGNGHTADTWNVVAQRFLESGYYPRELWAISYIDFFGGDSANSNMGNVEDVDGFINSVLDYTGADRVNLIAHSLGVTVARAWMVEKDAYDKVGHFIAIAGPNHGVNFCFGPQAGTALCQEIGYPNSDFLTYLNNPDETPLDDLVAYMTIYDGTGVDMFYPANAIFIDGSTGNLLESPRLEGATNVQLPGKNHFELKDSEESFDLMFDFLNKNGYYVQH